MDLMVPRRIAFNLNTAEKNRYDEDKLESICESVYHDSQENRRAKSHEHVVVSSHQLLIFSLQGIS
jgi:hypothetical protein